MEMNDNASMGTDTFHRLTVGLEPASCTPQDVSDAPACDELLTANQILDTRQGCAGRCREADPVGIVCSHMDNQIESLSVTSAPAC
jgi:hypothetical protein